MHQSWTSDLPEGVKLNIELEGIFMPYSRKKRDSSFPNGMRFAHYTTAEAALSIIESKRLWMRNATCMSDYREIQYGFDKLQKFLQQPDKRAAFDKALNGIWAGIGEEAIRILYHGLSHTRLETYITSVSEHRDDEDVHGRLSMWRAFGGTSGKVAFVFRFPFHTGAAEALNVMFAPVAYMSEHDFHGKFVKAIRNIEEKQQFLRTVDREKVLEFVYLLLLSSVVAVKHAGFHEEAEWRGIYNPTRSSSLLITPSTRIIQGIPQVIHQLPLDGSVSPKVADLDFTKVFDRLIIGPSAYPWVMQQAFLGALRRAGIPDAEDRVFVSDIPIRS